MNEQGLTTYPARMRSAQGRREGTLRAIGLLLADGALTVHIVYFVRCHCIFYGPGIRYIDIFGAPGYSVIIKLPCALLQTGHLETVHAPVADTVAYFADLDAPVVDTVTYFGGNHRSRV